MKLSEQLQRAKESLSDLLGYKPDPCIFIKSLDGRVLDHANFLPKEKEQEYISFFVSRNPKITIFQIEYIQFPNNLHTPYAQELYQQVCNSNESNKDLYTKHKLKKYTYNTKSDLKIYPSSENIYLFSTQISTHRKGVLWNKEPKIVIQQYSNIELKIEAIQILQGNAPERILENRFEKIRDLYPEIYGYLYELINDLETGHTYKDIRMMSDKFSVKKNIYSLADTFATEIKTSLSSFHLSTRAYNLKLVNNLPLGQVPTVQQITELFAKKYMSPKISTSAVLENEVSGQYEITNPIIQYDKNHYQILKAGNTPYSPNYKSYFKSIGYEKEFEKFETACVERTKWNNQCHYAILSHDIAEIYDLERKLPELDEQVEASRQSIYNELTRLCQQENRTISLFQEVQSSDCKSLIGDISYSSGQDQISNYRIMDKSTGKTEPLNIGDIDLNKQSPETIKEFLSGKQVEMTTKSGASQMVGLSKTPSGWGVQVGRQVFSTLDAGAEV